MSKLFRCLCPVIKPGLRNGFVIYVDGEAFHDVEAAGERLSQRVHSRTRRTAGKCGRSRPWSSRTEAGSN